MVNRKTICLGVKRKGDRNRNPFGQMSERHTEGTKLLTTKRTKPKGRAKPVPGEPQTT